MKAHEFLIGKGVKSTGSQFPAEVISKWLDEYAQIVLNIAEEKVKIKTFGDERDYYLEDYFAGIDRNSIINCLKD